uniref:Uncharacterized protein n=1 Tax=Myotis myotis TaxID=51298 RepID=A0A7J8AMR5_MYOMY|nr:hypothetical protein mMyoMyo1_008180 [Myotis myotis]
MLQPPTVNTAEDQALALNTFGSNIQTQDGAPHPRSSNSLQKKTWTVSMKSSKPGNGTLMPLNQSAQVSQRCLLPITRKLGKFYHVKLTYSSSYVHYGEPLLSQVKKGSYFESKISNGALHANSAHSVAFDQYAVLRILEPYPSSIHKDAVINLCNMHWPW